MMDHRFLYLEFIETKAPTVVSRIYIPVMSRLALSGILLSLASSP